MAALSFFFFKLWVYLFIYLWLCWVFVSVRGLSVVAASGGHSSSRCTGLSLSRPLLLRSTGSRRAGSVIVAHGPSCSTACGIFPDQGLNPCPLHRQADSQPLRHQESPPKIHFKTMNLYKIKMRSPNRVNNEKNQYMKTYIRIPYAIYNVLIDMHIHLNISLISTVFSMIFFPQKYTILLYSLIDYYVRN